MGRRIMVGLSGGPSAVINSTLAGIIRRASQSKDITGIYGAFHGVEGVLAGQFTDLSPYADSESLQLLRQTPAMALGSCRKKLTPEEYPKVEEVLNRHQIDCFLYVGGNDSMDTVLRLSRYFREKGSPIQMIGVPKTIDNDLPVTDHSPGFGSAARYLCHTMGEIIRDSVIYPVRNVVIVEIMGRDSGWLTLAAALPRWQGRAMPQIVALPEAPFDESAFIDQIHALFDRGDHTVVCAVSEGIRDAGGNYVGMSAKSGKSDVFGHKYLSGVGSYLERLVTQKIGCKVRSIELNVMQRCAAHLASRRDLDEARDVGAAAVDAALRGESGITLVFRRLQNQPYQMEITSTNVENIANQAQNVPKRWLCPGDPAVRQEVLAYLLPLIEGQPELLLDETGLPRYLEIQQAGEPV